MQRPKQGYMRSSRYVWWRVLVLMVLVFGFIWGAGLLWFVQDMASYQSPKTEQVEAIVVFTGGSERLAEGLALLQQDSAPTLFISGVGDGVTIAELLAENGGVDAVGSIKDRIILGYKAQDTTGNAVETAHWVEAEGITRIRLVTAGYHMARSRMELRAQRPSLEVIPHAVYPQNVKVAEWWRFDGTRALIIAEYHKLLAVALRQVFLGVGPNKEAE